MKLLVIGIDGGTKHILDSMPMPFVQALFSGAHSRKLEEDLISRGWAEILTGEQAADNKAFYLMPLNDGSYDFSASYSKDDMISNAGSEVLWQRLNKAGVSVGFCNVPTTGPADAVNGFVIAGGGGGIKADGSIPDTMVYPRKYKAVLDRNGYVFDVRLPSGTKTFSEFLDKINHAQDAQKNTFIELSGREDPDFGFHCFRITTEVQYLAREEIESCIQAIQESARQRRDFSPKNSVQEKIIEHYKHIDTCVREIFEALKPESYFFLADHSTALFEYEGNIDTWLREEGYLFDKTYLENQFFRIKRLLRRGINRYQVKRGLAKSIPRIRRPITKFSEKRTRAFGTFYEIGNFAGIFINDADRFSGKVKGASQIDGLVDELCERFNRGALAQEHRLYARPYRRTFPGAAYERFMPDIKIEKPDNIYFSGRKQSFLQPNENLGPMREDLANIRYPYTGLKGSDPLFVYSQSLENCIENDDPADLRLAYRMICRHFSA
ncbi:MAG: alkaline phosphatase family protein [Halioglobus sp.]|nr:alkaline phosphatase family protein [Halioglobus sp.]